MLNNVNLIGRVTKDIELRKTQSNKSVVKFTLAVDDGKDGQGNSRTQFIDCQAWEGLAETIQKYVLKGDMVNINGKLINNNYESNGVKYYSYLVLVGGMTLTTNKTQHKWLINMNHNIMSHSISNSQLEVMEEMLQVV